jgi:hypothetical protein
MPVGTYGWPCYVRRSCPQAPACGRSPESGLVIRVHARLRASLSLGASGPSHWHGAPRPWQHAVLRSTYCSWVGATGTGCGTRTKSRSMTPPGVPIIGAVLLSFSLLLHRRSNCGVLAAAALCKWAVQRMSLVVPAAGGAGPWAGAAEGGRESCAQAGHWGLGAWRVG